MMQTGNLFVRRAVRAALWTGGAYAMGLIAHSSMAQAQTQNTAADPETPALQEIQVTGSRIATPKNLDAISPVTVVSSEEVKQTGVTRVEDLLNSLPQVVADQGSGQSEFSNGTATINLRGLGAQRTLVLMDGRRLPAGDPGAHFGQNPSFASAADVNQVPVALIERVDVLTGGASSTYGADAVAGVVNFVMNDHFEGVRLDANAGMYNHTNHEGWINPLLEAGGYSPVTGTNWDGVNKDVALTMGHNFADGAGNFEGYLGYRQTSPVTADRRDHSACQLSDGAPTAAAPWFCGGSSNSAPAVFANPASPLGYQQITAGGGLAPTYHLYNYEPLHYLQRSDERYTAGFFGKQKFSDHVEAYTEFSFMDDKTVGAYAPSAAFLGSGKAIDAGTGLPDGALPYNCGSGGYRNAGMNPYITAAEFPILCPETAGGAPITYTNAANAALPPGSRLYPYQMQSDGTGQLLIGRRNVEGGPRHDNYEHIAYRGVFGARGEITQDWKYDAYAMFSETSSSDYHTNDLSIGHMQNALLASVDPKTGAVVCQGGQVGCAPWNVFNPAIPVSAAALSYLSVPAFFQATNQEDVASAYVSGDLTKKGIKTPWAEDGLKVVFGSEFRRDRLQSLPDAEYQSGDLGSVTLPVDAGQHVWEAFTEARMPLVKNMPGVKTLDFETGYRFSSYSEGFKTNTYKFGVDFAPVEDIRLRASFNRAVRAPNLQELYQPAHVTVDTGGDLCATGTKLTLAQCQLLGLTASQYANGGAALAPSYEYNGQLGGNANVKPEVGKTKEVGLVVTPTALPNFSATVDYSDITITNLINNYGPNVIQANCALTGSPTWCSLIHRDAAGTLWASPNAYTIDPVVNEGALEYKGVDVGLAYRFNLGSFGRVRTRFDGTWLKSLLYSPGAAASYDCAGRFGPSCSPVTPTWRHRMTADWETPFMGLSAGVTWRFFGSARNTLLDPKEPDYVEGLAGGSLPDARISTISYIDLRVSYTWDKKITVRAGVNNVMDKDPPNISAAVGSENNLYAEQNTYPSVYDTLGRYLFLNMTVDF